MNQVSVREEFVIIPTYEIAAYDKNPMFLEKRVYQGSSGRVYPHPMCEGVADEKTEKEYKAIFLENDYLLVMILPEIGGRVQRLYDKTNKCDVVYYNEVIKPALVGLAGPWISGGIEFNWPQHHRPSTYDAVDYKIEEHADGSATVWAGETEKMFHTKGAMGFTLYPDRAYLEIKGRVYNPTDRPQTFLWWANPAVAVNDDTQSIFPPDVHAVMDHGKRAVSKFPIADGEYYKVNYAPGTDLSRYKNIPVPTSYMAYHSEYDFVGNYDHATQMGLLHVADHHISPGKKQWTWGNGDFGKAWDRNLTDENGPYIELMTGMFTDNQPDFTFLKPYEEKTFVQYFMPYRAVGEVKNASKDAVVGLAVTERGAVLTVYAPHELKDVTITLTDGARTLFSQCTDIPTAGVYQTNVAIEGVEAANLLLTLRQNGRVLLVCRAKEAPSATLPPAAEPLPAPECVETTEKLFLAATHLEQYRHATYSPEPYYLEGLRRDPSDIRLNNGYGKYLYAKGMFAESEAHFRAAIASATWKNPNPYDCEPYYNLGLALERQKQTDAAFDAFYQATWDGNMQDKAFYKMACIAAGRGDLEDALAFCRKSLVRGSHNQMARTLTSALLRLTGRTEEAIRFSEESRRLDALDGGAYYELYRLRGEGIAEFRALMRGDNHNYIELALSYSAAQLAAEAADILRMAPAKDPMVHYYLYLWTKDSAELEKAERASSLYCFPNRLEDIEALDYAAKHGGQYAAYYLGLLLYDRERWQEAVTLWERCAAKIALPTVYRNLALAYYNKLHDAERAKEALERAFSMDQTDARVLLELDQLYRRMNLPLETRLETMEAHAELLETRDDLYTEYITLLNLSGAHRAAYDCIMQHQFHPWEGGEGKISAQYRLALIEMARTAERDEAIALLKQALRYPHNLGEGKLLGALDHDIYYLLGCLYDDPAQAKEAYRLASRGEFHLAPAMYYNDQPPQMMYYAAKAMAALGNVEEANARYKALVDYAQLHMDDAVQMDYFAVSLPDFLTFDGDLKRSHQVHCCMLAMFGYLGLGDRARAAEYAARGLSLDRYRHEFQIEAKGWDA